MASWSLKFNLSISHAPFSQRYYSTRVTNIIKKTGRKISIFHRSSQKLNQRVISKSTFPLIAKVIRLNQSANPFPPLNRSLLFRCIEQSLSFISIRILPPLEYFHPIVDSLSMISYPRIRRHLSIGSAIYYESQHDSYRARLVKNGFRRAGSPTRFVSHS